MGRAAYRREIWWAILFVGLVVGMWVGSEGGFSFLRGMGGGCRICEWRVIVHVIIEMELWLLLNQTRGTNVAF
jgi:hypothetical protein